MSQSVVKGHTHKKKHTQKSLHEFMTHEQKEQEHKEKKRSEMEQMEMDIFEHLKQHTKKVLNKEK